MDPVVCVGAALVDDSFFSAEEPAIGTSNPSTRRRSAGGVARNIAEHLARLGHQVELISHFGADADGAWLEARCRDARIGLGLAHRSEVPTGHYVSIISPGGELFTAASDTHCEELLTPEFLSRHSDGLSRASILLIDCNLSSAAICWLLKFAGTRKIPCIIEPVSASKAQRLSQADLSQTLLVTPNALELASASGVAPGSLRQVSIERLLARGVRYVWMREGNKGSLLASREESITMSAPATDVADTTGAGDAALAGWIYAWLRGKSARESLRYGHALAKLILQTHGANSVRLRPDLLESLLTEPHEP